MEGGSRQAVIPGGLLLLVGSGFPNTTELIPRKGDGDEVGAFLGFALDTGRQFHCLLQVDETQRADRRAKKVICPIFLPF